MKVLAESTDISYGMIPPQALELEDIVLGAILLEAEAINYIAGILTVDCFYSPKNKIIYQACIDLFTKNQPIDLATVVEQLKRNGILEQAGGAYEIALLTNNICSTSNIESHAKILYEKYMKRESIRLSNEIIRSAYSDTVDAFDLIDKAQIDFSRITEKIKSNKVTHISSIAFEVIKEMRENSLNNKPYLGLTSGLEKIDNITLGFCNPDLIIIAGGTGEGKSTLSLQIAQHVSMTKTVAVFSLEMSNKQLVWKVFSSHVNASVGDIRKGKLDNNQWKKLEGDSYNRLEESKLYLYDQGGMSIFDLISICRSMKSKVGLDMIVVDYLQLLNANGGSMKFGIREQEINYISKQLKALAKELDIPVIALSQLSRIEKGAKRMYRLSDLRESGAIEQDADGVIFVFRPHYHGIDSMSIGGEDMVFAEDDTIIQFAKWRLGETGITRLKFNKSSSRFEDYINCGYDVSKIRKEKNKDDYTDNCHDSDDIPF